MKHSSRNLVNEETISAALPLLYLPQGVYSETAQNCQPVPGLKEPKLQSLPSLVQKIRSCYTQQWSEAYKLGIIPVGLSTRREDLPLPPNKI